MYEDSLSRAAAESLVEFLRAAEDRYVVHFPHDDSEPYYRPAEYGGFLRKSVGSTELAKEHISDEELVTAIQDAFKLKILPAGDTRLSAWGTATHNSDN